LVGRGSLQLAQFIVTPMIASRLGKEQLAAYTIMNSLWIYPTIISDSLGMAVNIKGSQYLGNHKHSLFRSLTKYIPIAAFIVDILFVSTYYFGQTALFSLFTSDPGVLQEINLAFPYWLFAVFLGPFPGTYEGLVLAKQYFFLLFLVMVFGLSFWAAVTGLNMALTRQVSMVWAAVSVFMWTRFFPLFVIIYWEMYREWGWKDQDQTTTTVQEDDKLIQ